MATLLEVVQNRTKFKMCREMIRQINICERSYIETEHRSNDLGIEFNMSLPVYNFPVLFNNMLIDMGHDFTRLHNFETLDTELLFNYVLYDHWSKKKNRLVYFCTASCETPLLQNRFMQFMAYVVSVNRLAAHNIMERYAYDFQNEMLDEVFQMANLHTMLWWAHLVHAPLMINNYHSIMHSYMRTAPDNSVSARSRVTAPAMTQDLFTRLKMIVHYYGEAYLKHIPLHDDYATETLVTTALYNGDLTGTNPVMCELLHYLIHIAPDTLRIPGRKNSRHNAFTAVIERCNDETNPQHHFIVESVMQYARWQQDILDIVPDTGNKTLFQVAHMANNTLVLGYITNKFEASM